MIKSLTAQMEKIVWKVFSVREAESFRNEVISSKTKIMTIQSEIGTLKKIVGFFVTQIIQKTSKEKVKVPDPKPFQGNRSLKELENFLWNVEQYFKAIDVPKVEKVLIASIYLANDANL